MGALLVLKDICRHYQVGGEQLQILKNISLTIAAGEMVAIMGSSGSGKSTLLNIIGCLDQASSGNYYFDGRETRQMSGDELAQLRRERCGFIFQRYHLLPNLTAGHNVEIPAIYMGSERRQRHARAVELLQRLGIGERVDYKPAQLSGGQQQRVSIARALMNGGEVILADEPTGALDSRSGKEVMAILHQLQQQGHTVIIVTHDSKVAEQADRIIEIHDGEIIADRRKSSDVINSELRVSSNPSPVHRLRQLFGTLTEAFAMAWQAMVSRKMRTALTMLGIIIGIAAVVSIQMIGDAAQRQVLKDIRSIGTNMIDIYPGKDYADPDPTIQQALTAEDHQALLEQPYSLAVSPYVTSSEWLRSGNLEMTAQINGVNEQFVSVFNLPIKEGSNISEQQVHAMAQVILIDQNTRQRLFPHKRDVIGETVLVGDLPMMIIGVAGENKMIFGSGNMLRIWMPYTTLNNKILGQSWYSAIMVRLQDGYNSKQAEQQIEQLLTLRHGKKDFFTDNIDTIVKTAENVTRTLQLLLGLIAVISLVVGGIGVMNIMLVSVSERTQEIGIRMAVGARSRDLLQQFLIEAVLVCLTGGLLGVLLSAILGAVVQYFMAEWVIRLSLWALSGAFLCSLTVGILFGYLPARKAARLKPVEALMHE
ncbi:MAG: macrolide ABC transporter ATP-binding protein/permease MacB [Enterobacteriaceae bacterium]